MATAPTESSTSCPATGFERNNEAELVTTFGNWYQTNDQLNFGSHTDRFAYYASVNGNRSNYGLADPHCPGFSRCGERLWRIRFVHLQSRCQEPISAGHLVAGGLLPDSLRPGSQLHRKSAVGGESGASPSYGLRDGEHERDGYVTFSWVRTFNANTLLTVSPFYHYNSADYQGGASDYPVISTTDQAANYGGLQAALNEHFWRNDLEVGVYGFAQHQNNLFNNQFTDGRRTSPPLRLA